MNIFEFVNAINTTKENLIESDPSCEKAYVPFMVNRSLSYFHDTILYANEMNRYSHLDKKLQFDFLLNSITKKKRFSKWSKKQKEEESILMVMEYYDYSAERAREAAKILSDDQFEYIKQKLNKGGRK